MGLRLVLLVICLGDLFTPSRAACAAPIGVTLQQISCQYSDAAKSGAICAMSGRLSAARGAFDSKINFFTLKPILGHAKSGRSLRGNERRQRSDGTTISRTGYFSATARVDAALGLSALFRVPPPRVCARLRIRAVNVEGKIVASAYSNVICHVGLLN